MSATARLPRAVAGGSRRSKGLADKAAGLDRDLAVPAMSGHWWMAGFEQLNLRVAQHGETAPRVDAFELSAVPGPAAMANAVNGRDLTWIANVAHR